MQLGWAPNVIAGRWNKENKRKYISAETIYTFIYHKTNKNLQLWKLLFRARKRRGIVRKQRSSQTILYRVSIHDRPAEIATRKSIGHYEADLMFNSGNRSANVLTLIERKSRMVLLAKNQSKQSKEVIESLKQRLSSSAKSCTFDNGKEFALHHELNIPTFFCDPGSPWQKGSVENMNRLLRHYLPFSLHAHFITQEYLDMIASKLNNMPRKKLKFLTPLEHHQKIQESRLKPALPAAEVVSQNLTNHIGVALHS